LLNMCERPYIVTFLLAWLTGCGRKKWTPNSGLDVGQFFGTLPDPTHTKSDSIRPDPRFGADE